MRAADATAPGAASFQATLTRAAQLVASPWKNGGGVTREIATGAGRASAAGSNAQDAAASAATGATAATAATGATGATGAARFDTFAWRVSLADVAQPGPFSRFDDIDRVLVLLSGAGMLLDEGGAVPRTHTLRKPLDLARFAGEAAIDARLVDGATRDFNLMTRRGVATGDVEVWQGSGSHRLSADVVLLFCASGALTVRTGEGAPVHLEQDDTLRFDPRAAARLALNLDVQGNGALLAIRIDLHEPASS